MSFFILTRSGEEHGKHEWRDGRDDHIRDDRIHDDRIHGDLSDAHDAEQLERLLWK
jgi:hypothetical protein